jgi:hypothetical protein
MDKTPVDKTPAITVRVAATVTSVDVTGAAPVCPVGALEHVAGKDVDGVGHPHMGTWLPQRCRWLAGKPLDTPIRGYQRYEEGPPHPGLACAVSQAQVSVD